MTPEEKTQIENTLRTKNGRRRTRLLQLEDIEYLLSRIQTVKTCWIRGGSVANAYNYPAVTTCAVAARREDGRIALAIGLNDAHKNSSPRPTNCSALSKRERDLLKWANSMQAADPDNGIYLLY